MILYGLYFSRGETVIRLPQNPSELPTYEELNTETYNVLGIGDVILPKKTKLRKVSIKSYFPAWDETYPMPTWFLHPEDYINFFLSAMKDQAVITYVPVRIAEDGKQYFVSDSGMQCYVTSFTYEEKGGETGDFYYEITLQEFRDYTPQTAVIPDSENLFTSPTRAPADDEITVGDVVEVSGPVSPSPGVKGTTVTKKAAKVERVENDNVLLSDAPFESSSGRAVDTSPTRNRYRANKKDVSKPVRTAATTFLTSFLPGGPAVQNIVADVLAKYGAR